MSNYASIRMIEARKPEGKPFEFILIVETPHGTSRLPVPANVLLSYAAVQRHVVANTGCMFKHAWAEGRQEPAADEQWRDVVAQQLSHPPGTTSDVQ
jgi:hypothetical protein